MSGMKTYQIETKTLVEQPTAVAHAILPVVEIGPWLAKAYGHVAAVLASQGAPPAGPPFARYRKLGNGTFEVEAGFPVLSPIRARGEVRASILPGGPAANTVHTGPYDEMEPAYEALAEWVRSRGDELAGDAWEIYFSDPIAEPNPASWRTEIVQPYRAI
jgi:effector-binding domain-containing protein